MSEGKSNANWNCIVIAARSLLLVYLLYTVRPVTAYEGKLEIEGKPEVSKSVYCQFATGGSGPPLPPAEAVQVACKRQECAGAARYKHVHAPGAEEQAQLML